MNGGKIQDPEQIRKILDVSANKNNNLLIFFLTFALYILISTLGTTDLTLLLPKHGFKMPLIDFELDLLNFFILGPLLLLLLHFNILFNHHKHLKKLYIYKDKIDINTIDPSIYSFAFTMGNHGFSGRMINLVLWILLYIIPLLIFLIIYIRFADYHHAFITPLHLLIIILDLVFIISSISYNNNFYKSKYNDLPPSKFNIIIPYFSYAFFIFTGILMAFYFYWFFYPITYKEYNPLYLEKIKKDFLPIQICKVISPLSEHKDCCPRLVVTEEEMAKISPAALYIPRYLAMDEAIKDKDKEKKLILDYGTRIDLTNRNLRYANLKKCILTRADMQYSQLQAANLMESHLQAADFRNANLQDANLLQAKLQSSWLNDTQLQGASFASANMQEAELGNSNLTNANLQNVQLQLAKFGGTELGNADFRGAELVNADFRGANLTGASLHNANITSAVFDKANLMATDFSNASFVKGDWTSPTFKEATMFGVNISKNKLHDINLTTCQKQFIFDVNVSKEYLTFDGRRVKYLNTIIKEIVNANTECISQKDKLEKLTKLRDILNTSCKHLKNEASIYRIREDIENIYNELMTICNH